VRLEVPAGEQDIGDFGLLDLAPGEFVTREHPGQPHALDGRSVRVASGVVEEGRGQGGSDVSIFEVGAGVQDALQGKAREVVDTDRVVEPVVLGGGEGEGSEAQSIHSL
jgi:hypothetical protein